MCKVPLLYRRLRGRRTYLGARMKNEVSWRGDEERRIGARMKNDECRKIIFDTRDENVSHMSVIIVQESFLSH